MAITKISRELEEHMYPAPTMIQMTPVRDRIINKLQNVPLFDALIVSINKSTSRANRRPMGRLWPN